MLHRRNPPIDPDKLGTARKLRRDMTDAEQKIWKLLRGRKLGGVKFRRQYPVGPYFADFCSVEHLLVIELDGGQHSESVVYDDERTAYLQREGYRVIRFWNNQALAETELVAARILDALGLR
ncbi:MAG: endonuclease domain-containing protein [Candidatus Binataceae bacterium]